MTAVDLARVFVWIEFTGILAGLAVALAGAGVVGAWARDGSVMARAVGQVLLAVATELVFVHLPRLGWFAFARQVVLTALLGGAVVQVLVAALRGHPDGPPGRHNGNSAEAG